MHLLRQKERGRATEAGRERERESREREIERDREREGDRQRERDKERGPTVSVCMVETLGSDLLSVVSAPTSGSPSPLP